MQNIHPVSPKLGTICITDAKLVQGGGQVESQKEKDDVTSSRAHETILDPFIAEQD